MHGEKKRTLQQILLFSAAHSSLHLSRVLSAVVLLTLVFFPLPRLLFRERPSERERKIERDRSRRRRGALYYNTAESFTAASSIVLEKVCREGGYNGGSGGGGSSAPEGGDGVWSGRRGENRSGVREGGRERESGYDGKVNFPR